MKTTSSIIKLLAIVLSTMLLAALALSVATLPQASAEEAQSSNKTAQLTASFDESFKPSVGANIPQQKMFSNIECQGATITKTEEHWWYTNDLNLANWPEATGKFEAGYYYEVQARVYFSDISALDIPSMEVLINGKKATYWDTVSPFSGEPGLYYFKWKDATTQDEYLCIEYFYPKLKVETAPTIAEDKSPQTGDNFAPFALVSLMIVSGAFATIAIRRKINNRK